VGRRPFGEIGLVRITTAAAAISLVVAGVALGQSGTRGSGHYATVRDAVYVVLVTGINDAHGGKTPTGDCEGGPAPCHRGSCAVVGSMEQLCDALEAQGDLVWVPPAAKNSGDPAVIHTRLSVDENAASLAAYITNTGADGALVVGHSMGGLIARAAIERDQAYAVGLFTIGTPWDGSYAADLLETAQDLPCPPEAGDVTALCEAVVLAAKGLILYGGRAAVYDLSAAGRVADNSTLGPLTEPFQSLPMPVWALAGTACQIPDVGGYYSPNDGVVGESSAWGVSADLGTVRRYVALAYHSTGIPQVCGNRSYTIEQKNPTVIALVQRAAQRLGAGCELKGDCLSNQPVAGDAATGWSSAAAKPARIVLSLVRVSGKVLKAGARISVTPGTSLISTGSFSLGCRGHRVAALRALGGRIFGFPAGAMPCSQAKLEGRGARHVVMATDQAKVRAVLASVSQGRVSVTVTAKRPITRLVLTRGRRTVRVIRAHMPIRLKLTRAQALGLTITATVAGHRYATTITALP
jgi:pimeloyl-ACP methyl ester carboxylesterase